MERVLTLTSFEEEAEHNSALEHWLSRPAEERLAEVARLRREYISNFGGANGCREGLRGSLLFVEREER